MKDNPISIMDFIIATHKNLERQGPGSREAVIKALGFLDALHTVSKAADLGCGGGGQTMVLAEHIHGSITGVDLLPDLIDVLNDKARTFNLHPRVRGIVGSMDDLPFEKEELDLIWSEGAIDHIGFEKGMRYWNRFLKKGGYVAVSCPSWFTAEHPDEVEKFWSEAGSGLEPAEHHIAVMQQSGYRFIAAFALPERCWTENYFVPRAAAEEEMLRKYAGNQAVEGFVKNSRHEVDLYEKYKQHYGYTFYIGQKI